MTPSPALSSRAARLRRIQDMLITRLEAAMDSLERQVSPEKEPDNPLRTALMRQFADGLAFWGNCGNRACLRARRCRRSPRDCAASCAPLVPPEVRASAIAKLRRAFP